MKIKLSKNKKRLVLAGSVLLVLLLVALYAWLSYQSWSAYAHKLDATSEKLSSLKRTAETSDDPTKRLEALRQLDSEVARRDTFCQPDAAFAWQSSVVPVIAEGQKSCERAVRQLDEVERPLSELRAYLDLGVELQDAFQSHLDGPSKVSESNWGKDGLDRARRLTSTLESIDAEDKEARKLKSSAVSYATDLTTAWRSLIQAHEAKDETAYIKASQGVEDAYTAFSKLADDSDETLKLKVDALTQLKY